MKKTTTYQFLQDQYLADVLSLAVSQRCLALNERLRAGLLFRILILGSPKLTLITLPLAFLT